MSDQVRVGFYLLFPPTVLWLLIILFSLDNTLAQYIISMLNRQVMDMILYIAGLIFPAAGLVVGVRAMLLKQNKMLSLALIGASTLLITLTVLMVFVF